MKLMVTGHRPNRLGGYRLDSSLVKSIDGELRKIVSALDPDTDIAICGMAQGVDQMFAGICMEFGIPVHAYIPFVGQESRWPARAQKEYRSMLARCAEVVVVADSESVAAFNVRNAVMVRDCDRGVAVWNGSAGGTANAVSLLRVAGRPVIMIDIHR